MSFSWLQNSWMDNPTFLAEMAHFAWAYGILLTAALWSVQRRHIVQLFLAFVAFAVVKEFWYDLRYEVPVDTVAGSALDFAVYMLGGCVALLVIWIRRRVEQKAAIENAARRLMQQQINLNSFIVRGRSGAPEIRPRIYSEE